MSFNEENRFNRSSYRIAERNRLAKQRFLSQIDQEISSDQVDLNQEFASRRTTPGMPRKHVDLSVPGTPVSSKRVMAMKQGLDYDSDEEEDWAYKTRRTNKESSQQMKDLVAAIQKLTVDGEQRTTENFGDKINEPKILNNENSIKHYPMYSSVPGTPINSRHLMRYKAQEDVEETFDNIKTTEEGKDQLQEFIKSMEKLRVEKLQTQISETQSGVTNKNYGYSKVGLLGLESNLKPFTPSQFDHEKILETHAAKSNQMWSTTSTTKKFQSTNTSKLTTEVTIETPKDQSKLTSLKLNIENAKQPALHSGYDLLSPTLVRKTLAKDGFYTRTYSRGITKDDQLNFDQIENDIDAETTPQNGHANGIHHVQAETPPKLSSRTSLPARTAIPAPTSQPTPLRRSLSNTEKFYEILNRFRRNEPSK